MKKLSIFMAVAVVFTLFTGVLPAQAAEYALNFEETAESVYMVNMDTDTVVFEKNADERRSPASITKIMTMVLALEMCADPAGTYVTAPSYIWDEFEGISISHCDIKRGETLTMQDLLYGMALQSANEAANIVADYLGGGSISDFVELMNQKAQEIGAVNTHFTNPHGLYSADHYTTAYDIYLIAKYALGVPGFKELISTPVYTALYADMHTEALNFYTTNKMMVKNSDYYYEGLSGIKTGTLPESGRCFVSTATRNGFTYLLVVLGCPAYDEEENQLAVNYAFVDAEKFYDWAFSTFKVKTLVEEGKIVGQTGLELSWGKDYLLTMTSGRFTALLPEEIQVSSVVTEAVFDQKAVRAPVKKGDKVGYLKLILAGEEVGRVDLVAAESAEMNEWLFCLDYVKQISQSFWFKFAVIFVAVLIVFYVVLVVIRNRNRRRYQSVRRRRRL
ncbi:MAG: D-alanyl-D-alanine carboxypeptidase [Oscillospiraceae bacterium]|nr:D-alanyl-D-alanine carboxypeptidase [Oscillospiraceae bacterium]